MAGRKYCIMMELRNYIPWKGKRLSAVLGLSLDGSKLEGVVVRRTDAAFEIQQPFSASLSLDPLTADPELVGRELRNHLDQAGIKERACVLALPLKWVLTTQVEVPAMPEADVPGFLQIEAERGFHADTATLHVTHSISRSAAGRQHALLAAIPKGHLEAMEKVLRAARLSPVSFSLALPAMQPPAAQPNEGVLAVALGETNVGLQITCGGGIAALRTVEGALETEGSRRLLNAEVIAREARITLGQLAPDTRQTVRQVKVFGPRELSQQLADEIELRLEPLGLQVESVRKQERRLAGLALPADAPVSAAISVAAERLAGTGPALEFLPPRVTAWQRVSNRYASGKLRTAGAIAGAAVLIVICLFLYQQFQLTRLDAEWKRMAPKVSELDKITQQSRQYRPWFDESFRSLTILKQLTQAFPEEGSVSAKSIEIRDQNIITCTGVARDNPSLLKTLDRLRTNNEVSELKVDQIRGKPPTLQFTFDFRWNEGGRL
jgi:hypothetical protein